MYPGAINKAAAKEATQNSVDASRGMPGAHARVSIDNQGRSISIVDQGKGMTPQVMEDVFVKLVARTANRGQRRDGHRHQGHHGQRRGDLGTHYWP